VVTVTSSGDAAIVPATVTVPSGSSSQTFDIQTTPATIPVTIIITATYSDHTRTATLTLGKLAIQTFSLSATSVIGGAQVVGTITLSAPAPAGGVGLTVTSESAVARVPSVVNVPAGETSQIFPIDTTPSSSPVTAAIIATLPYSGSAKTATLVVGHLSVQAVSLGVDTVPGGLPVSGTVVLSVATPADTIVTLSSDSTVASVPPTVTVPAGAISEAFEITTTNAPPSRAVTIGATYAGSTGTARLTVMAYPTVSGLSCATTTPKPGSSVGCTGTLAAPTPAGGWQLAIASSDDSLAGAVPSAVTIAPGGATFSFEVVTAPVTTTNTAVIRIVDAPSGVSLYSQALTITP